MDFRIWATITFGAPNNYVAVVSAVPDSPDDDHLGVTVRNGIVHSHGDAIRERERLMNEVGERVRFRGDRIVDVEAP